MGILDDAIREHLDLKRKHGARDAELQQLEDEAFGPPSRPDEPDFPERPPTGEHAAAQTAAPPAVEQPIPEPDLPDAGPNGGEAAQAYDEPTGEEDAHVFYDQASERAEPPEPEAIAGEPTAEHEVTFGEDEDEAPVAERRFEQEPELAEPEGALPGFEPEPEPEPASAGAEPVRDGADFEIGEIDLEIEEEFADLRETGEPQAPAADDAEAEDEDGEEDVLEETPEFLRDTPEDERLWFEQGAPRDFDFEDDEKD